MLRKVTLSKGAFLWDAGDSARTLAVVEKGRLGVKTEKGYEGPAVVCAVTFVPIAGYIPTRAAIKYLQEQRDIEIWLAPIGTSRVLVPYRISIPTPIGVGVMQATQFVALPPSPPQAAAAGPKTQ